MTNTTRRAILTGLAATPMAALPAIAGAAPTPCPTVAAAREYQRLLQIERAAGAECSRIYADLEATHRAIGAVEIRDESVYRLVRLHSIRSWPGLPNAEYEAARDLLEPLQEAHKQAHSTSGYDEAEATAHEAEEISHQALVRLFDTSPVSSLGALELLRVCADEIEEAGAPVRYDIQDRFVAAIREAIAVLEKTALRGVDHCRLS